MSVLWQEAENMDYTFRTNDSVEFQFNKQDNMRFGMTVGSAGNAVIPENVVTSDTIKHIETVTQEWYQTNSHNKDTLYIINEGG